MLHPLRHRAVMRAAVGSTATTRQQLSNTQSTSTFRHKTSHGWWVVWRYSSSTKSRGSFVTWPCDSQQRTVAPMHSIHTGRCPTYLINTVQLAATHQWPDSHVLIYRYGLLRNISLSTSATQDRKRAGPSAWNTLPTHIRDVPNSTRQFRKLLTNYFLA